MFPEQVKKSDQRPAEDQQSGEEFAGELEDQENYPTDQHKGQPEWEAEDQ